VTAPGVVPSEAIVGFVGAGGPSRRMGRDKALLRWGGGTLLDHAITRLRAVCREVRISSGREPRYADRGLPVDIDGLADGGPLAGLATALSVAAPRAVLLLGVDMPFVTVALLARLRDALAGVDAVVPVLAAGAEPLCAAYAHTCAVSVQAALAAGQRKMTSFWPHLRVRSLGEADLAAFGPSAQVFRNINDSAEYDAALAASDASADNP
jgi:molybdopterin-guanine dinucleotide biosynthesis protein A